MKLKVAGIILICAASIALINDMSWLIKNLVSDLSIYKHNPMYLLSGVVSLFIPTALVLLGIALMTNKIESASGINVQNPINPKDSAEHDYREMVENMSVGEWILQYLILLVPVVGFIFLIVWASDNDKPLRKNYAIASIIWSVISSLFFVIIIFALKEYYLSSHSYYNF
jgi:hypothetical protein